MGTINGVPAHEYSIETTEEKPWLKPGADITGNDEKYEVLGYILVFFFKVFKLLLKCFVRFLFYFFNSYLFNLCL